MAVAVARGEHGKANILNQLPKPGAALYWVSDDVVSRGGRGHGGNFPGRWIDIALRFEVSLAVEHLRNTHRLSLLPAQTSIRREAGAL